MNEELTEQMRADIIRVARHVRSHDDRPYEEADRLLALLAPDDAYAPAQALPPSGPA